jgi:hypothetical protein
MKGSGVRAQGSGKRGQPVRLSAKGRVVTVDCLALARAIQARTLTDADRQLAEKIMPGICDAVMGKPEATR